MDQVSIKYTNIFDCKTLQNLPNFLVWKQTIRQPWSAIVQNGWIFNRKAINVSVCIGLLPPLQNKIWLQFVSEDFHTQYSFWERSKIWSSGEEMYLEIIASLCFKRKVKWSNLSKKYGCHMERLKYGSSPPKT
jgi:hypothetical protein